MSKHDTLQQQSDKVNELLSKIKSVSQADAYKIIDFIRKDKNVASTLEFARTLPAPGAPAERIFNTFRNQNVDDGSLTAVPYGGYSSNASIALDLNAGRFRHDAVVPSGSSGRTAGPSTTTLPPFSSLLAAVNELENQPTERRTRMRRSPSAPDLRPADTFHSACPDSVPIWRYDKRLDRVNASDWGVTYVDDAGFRNIITSFLIWDHQSGRCFDEDDFLEGLVGGQSVSCSQCLVHAVLAYGSLNYSHVDPRTAGVVHKAAWAEAQNIWDATVDKTDSIADAEAGMLIWALHAFNGTDKLGLNYLSEMRHIGKNMGLYDKDCVARVYNPSNPRVSRARAIHAWGIYNWVKMVELAFLSDLDFPNPPPVPMPQTVTDPVADGWTPWPCAKIERTIPALTDETGIARASLSSIICDIVPLRRKYLNAALTRPYLDAAVDIYRRLCEWWESVNPALKNPQTLEDAPPHAFIVSLLYNYAIVEVFRAFTTTPTRLSPHAAPLQKALLPVEPALAASTSAALRQRDLLQQINRLYGRDQLTSFFIFFTWPIAYETLPSASPLSPNFSAHAADTFLATLCLVHRAGKQFPIMLHAALGIEQTASKLGIVLLEEAKDLFDDIKRNIAKIKDREAGRSDWVVVLNTANIDIQASRLNNLVRDLEKIGITA